MFNNFANFIMIKLSTMSLDCSLIMSPIFAIVELTFCVYWVGGRDPPETHREPVPGYRAPLFVENKLIIFLIIQAPYFYTTYYKVLSSPC